MSRTERRLTFDEFLACCPEGRLVEWVDGEAMTHVPPTERHQDVAGFLASLLRQFAEWSRSGRVLIAPFLMRARPDGPAREPDVLFVTDDHLPRLLPDRLEGPADLVVEVVSPDSVARDRADKFYEYQAGGVREYWIVDPRPGCQRADFWRLDADGTYQPVSLDAEGVYRSTVLPGFWLRTAWLRADPLPNVLTTFAEIVELPPAVRAALTPKHRPSRGSTPFGTTMD